MFTTDTRTENFLNQMGAENKYTNDVSISELERGWNETNLSRPVPLREDAIVEYAALMESGSAAPAPVLHYTPRGYAILDGVQRISAAALVGTTKISAYVVTCDSEDMLSAIRVLANARLQGRPEPPEWTRRRAVDVLVVQRGLSVAEVARMGGWNAADVADIAQSIEWGLAIQAIAGPKLSDIMIRVVSEYVSRSELASAPGPTAEFLQAVKDAKFSAADASPYVRSFFLPVVKRKRHGVLMERLAAFKSEPEVQTRLCGRKGAAMTSDILLRRALKTSLTVLEEIEKGGGDILYVDEFFKLTKEIDKKLHSLAKNHQKSIAARVPADRYVNT